MKPLDHVQLLGVGQPAAVEPEAFVEAARVHDQRVALPTADGVAVVAGKARSFGCIAAVEVRSCDRYADRRRR